MAIVKCKETVNPQTKEVVTVLVDSFGSKHLVQSPLLDPNHDHDKIVADEIKAMDQAEKTFIAALKARGMKPADINALKKDPKDCGCA